MCIRDSHQGPGNVLLHEQNRDPLRLDLVNRSEDFIDDTKASASSEVVNARFLCNQRVGDGSLKAPNGPSVKASVDRGRNSPQNRFCRPVEIFLGQAGAGEDSRSVSFRPNPRRSSSLPDDCLLYTSRCV